MRTVRVGLIICDSPLATVQPERNYLPVFKAFLVDSLKQAGRADDVELDLIPYDVRLGHFPSASELEGLSALLLTGSASTSYDDATNPWIQPTLKFLRAVHDEHPEVRLICHCFGMQLITRAWGGTVSRNANGWEIGTYSLDLTPDGQELFGCSKLPVQQMHLDQASEFPPSGDFKLLASSPKTAIHAFASFYPSGKVHVFAIQGHPEIVQLMVDARSASGVFNEEVTREARERAVVKDEGRGLVGALEWAIMLGEK